MTLRPNALVFFVIVAACSGLESVRASDYDQSCVADTDCVLVNELVVNDGECSDCNIGPVNVKDAPRMRSDVMDMRDDCPTDGPSASCAAAAGVAGCVSGHCAIVPKPQDTGAD